MAAYGLTGEWYWMVLTIGNGMNAYVFGPDEDDDETDRRRAAPAPQTINRRVSRRQC